jgi:tetratricopeptide (TPR) repeat protein
MTDVIDTPPLASGRDWAEGTRLLEQAVKAGSQDPSALYLLAMGYKHLGRTADARHILSKIAEPDANVLLQRGVLAFADKDYVQAAAEFAHAWEQAPNAYAAGYNLLLAQLCQGELDAGIELLARLVPLAPTPGEQRFLSLVRSLLSPAQEDLLGSISAEEEARLLGLVLGLNRFEAAYQLLSKLLAARPESEAAFKAYISAALVQGKQWVDRCEWAAATALLAPLQRRLEASKIKVEALDLIALYNLLGTCACMEQDFERGLGHFRQAQETFARDFAASGPADKSQRYVNTQNVYMGAWLEQNMALASEWLGRLELAETHWNRYFDFLEHYFPRSLPPDYLPTLAFEGMSRLADLFSRKERWGSAIHFLQRASRVRPTDYETMERLFHLYNQLKRTDDARRLLKKLREVRPNDPQAELFELEVREVRKIDEVERLLGDLRRLQQRFPNDTRVDERGAALVHHLVPTLERIADQYASQVNKVSDQMRRLPSYQINWPTVREIMRDLEDKYLFLRRLAQKALAQVRPEDARRDLNRLIAHCDRKIDQCHSLGE